MKRDSLPGLSVSAVSILGVRIPRAGLADFARRITYCACGSAECVLLSDAPGGQQAFFKASAARPPAQKVLL